MSRILNAVLKSARNLHRAGFMDDGTFACFHSMCRDRLDRHATVDDSARRNDVPKRG